MKQTTDILTIAVIGAGYAARLHGDAYKRVYGASLMGINLPLWTLNRF